MNKLQILAVLALVLASLVEPYQMGSSDYIRTLLIVSLCYVVLIAIQVGCPLQFNTPNSKRFESPITPAAYAFSVWGIIFMLEAASVVITLVPGCESWSRPIFMRVGKLMAATWLAEASWTTIQYLQQQLRPGRELAIGFWAAALALVLGHVLVSLALREGVLELQAVMERGKPSALDEQLMAAQQAHSGKTLSVEEEAARVLGQSGQEGAISSWGVAGACVLYIFPLALNAGWMGLATCLGIMQVCAVHGLSYLSMVTPGLCLMVLAACTLGAQPWCAVPPMPFTFKTHLPHLMAHLSYKLVLAWGLLGIRQAGRPKQVHDLALVLLLALPAIGAAGITIKVWLGNRLCWLAPASIGYQAAPSFETAK
mmetsp:Transcript_18380/g.47927  ORF Transcript_18380/g.47927 Transcript_18380/m.47927 type:complete len:369 (+) Transcript_18380:65-1171(+)